MEKKVINDVFIDTVLDGVREKEQLLNASKGRYIIKAMMAGVIVTFGYLVYIALMANFGGYEDGILGPLGKVYAAAFFSLCLVTIYFSKSELLTSNMMMTSVAMYFKEMTIVRAVKLMVFCYIGNFLGGFLMASLISLTTIINTDSMAVVMEHVFASKVIFFTEDSSILDLLIRAIFCNMFINFSMMLLYSGVVKSEFGKIISVFFGVFIFMYLGLEHSVANTIFFSIAGMFQLMTGVQIGFALVPAVANVVVALIGNMIGGGLCIGVTYAYVNTYKK